MRPPLPPDEINTLQLAFPDLDWQLVGAEPSKPMRSDGPFAAAVSSPAHRQAPRSSHRRLDRELGLGQLLQCQGKSLRLSEPSPA
eukprot:6410277-Prymnesium_polylepis.1